MEKLMTAKQVGELLEVNLSTVYHWVHIGLIPYVKLGKCVRFKKSELFRWIDKICERRAPPSKGRKKFSADILRRGKGVPRI